MLTYQRSCLRNSPVHRTSTGIRSMTVTYVSNRGKGGVLVLVYIFPLSGLRLGKPVVSLLTVCWRPAMRCQSSGSHLYKPTYPTAVRGQLLVAPDRIRRRRFEHPRKTSLGIVSKPGEIIIIIIVASTGMRRLTGRCVDPQHSEAAPRTVTRTPASWGSPHRLYNNPTPELPSPARQ